MQVLSVIVPAPIDQHLADSEELAKLLETRGASRALRNDELVKHLTAGSVADPATSASLRTKPIEKHPSPSTKPTTQPVLISLSCWFSAPTGLSLPMTKV